MSRDPDPAIGDPAIGDTTNEDSGDKEAGPEHDPDLDGEESFPASDPPAHWGGEDRSS